MSPEWIGFLGILAMLGLLTLRMPIGIAMLLVGSVGFAILNGPQQALMALGTYPYSYAAYYDLAVIPLFVLMGNLAAASGMGRALCSRRRMPGSATGAAALPPRPSCPAPALPPSRDRASRRRSPWARSACPR